MTQPDALSHDQAQQLLPWLATGALEPALRAAARQHVAQCAACTRALDEETRLRNAVQALAATPVDVDAAWAALRPRLAPRPARAHPRRRAGAALARFLRRPRTVGRLAAAQLAVLAASLLILLWLPRPATHQLLASDAPAAAGNALIIFDPQTPEADMRRLLRTHRARLLDGPTDADAYVLALPPATRDTALAALRKEPRVLLAEPIEPAA